jgi:hypothetical protein
MNTAPAISICATPKTLHDDGPRCLVSESGDERNAGRSLDDGASDENAEASTPGARAMPATLPNEKVSPTFGPRSKGRPEAIVSDYLADRKIHLTLPHPQLRTELVPEGVRHRRRQISSSEP